MRATFVVVVVRVTKISQISLVVHPHAARMSHCLALLTALLIFGEGVCRPPSLGACFVATLEAPKAFIATEVYPRHPTAAGTRKRILMFVWRGENRGASADSSWHRQKGMLAGSVLLERPIRGKGHATAADFAVQRSGMHHTMLHQCRLRDQALAAHQTNVPAMLAEAVLTQRRARRQGLMAPGAAVRERLHHVVKLIKLSSFVNMSIRSVRPRMTVCANCVFFKSVYFF